MTIMTVPETEEKFEKWEEVESKLRKKTRPQRGVHPSERMSIFAQLWWGIILLWPNNTFDSSKSFETMHKLADEWIWGLVILVLSLYHICALIFHLHNPKGLIFRQIAISLGVGVWAFLAVTLFLGNVYSPAWGIYVIFTVSQCFALEATWRSE